MVHAEYEGGDRITVTVDLRDRELIRMVPGTSWDRNRSQGNTSVWTVPLSWGPCVALRGVFGDRLEVGPQLAAWANDVYREQVYPALMLRDMTEFDTGSESLYPFQRAGVEFMRIAKQAILADEMGTGKTIQTISVLAHHPDPFPCLIICPNSMKITWKREFERWWPGVDCVVIGGSAVARRKQIESVKHVGIINWESLRLHTRLAPYGSVALTAAEKKPKELNGVDWRTVVADEAHRMIHPRSKQTRAVWWLGRQAEYRYALTGTPIANHPDDLWAIAHFISPTDWPAKTVFIDRYCLQSWNVYGGIDVIGVKPETRDEFFKILDPRFRRMPKDLVLPYLPKKLRQYRYVELGNKQRKAYDQMRKQMLAELDAGLLVGVNPLTRALRLMQFSSAYAEMNEDGDVRLTEPSCKLDALDEVLEELGDEPLVVFSESRQLIELACTRLEKAHISFSKIVGGLTPLDRDLAQQSFQEGRVRVILLTLGAGSEGLTLTRARHAVFLQRSWSMLKNKQAEDRIHRIGSEIHDKIFIIYIVSVDTVEDRQLIMLDQKAERLEEIVRDHEKDEVKLGWEVLS